MQQRRVDLSFLPTHSQIFLDFRLFSTEKDPGRPVIGHPRVLLVCAPEGVARTFAAPLAEADCDVVAARDFPSARAALAQRPTLLITDLKLGAYNGLHLAIRAGMVGTAAVVIGHADPVLQADADRHNAIYLTVPLDMPRVFADLRKLLEATVQSRRSERRQVTGLEAVIDRSPARVVDVSYHGMRIETSRPAAETLPPYFLVRLPQLNFACQVQRIWTAPAESASQTTAIWCGAAIAAADLAASSRWRLLVDGLPGWGT